MKLILGSSSQFRRAVMDELGFEYEVMAPEIDEKAILIDDPDALVLAIAHAKADALVGAVEGEALIITSDQVVVWNGEIREKPQDREEAKRFIMSYGEHPAVIINGLVVTHVPSGRRVELVSAMHTWYMPIPDLAAEEILDTSDVMFCAGGLQTEHPLFRHFMIHTDGSDDHAMGLPKGELLKLLTEFKYQKHSTLN
jgi:septum formation protein